MVRELIRLEDVHRALCAVTVLDGINLRIDEGDRIGVLDTMVPEKQLYFVQSQNKTKMWATSTLHPVYVLPT